MIASWGLDGIRTSGSGTPLMARDVGSITGAGEPTGVKADI